MIKEKLSFTCDILLSHQQLACCDRYCGIPHQGKNVLIYSNKKTQQKPLLLTGHHGDISAMTFGKRSSPVTLCSASSEYIIIWDIEACQKRTEEGKLAAGTVIGTLLGNVVHLSFCSNDELVAVCSGTTIYVLNSKKQEVICTLNGHLGFLTSTEFCPWNTNILVSTSEDRTFKVWDLKIGAVFYQSFVLGGNIHFLSEKNHGGYPNMKIENSKYENSRFYPQDNSWFCVGSTDGLYVVELATSELLTVLYFKGGLLGGGFFSQFFFFFFFSEI
uniref:Uncharacterized protein n=1 Tax=Poecilia mexicana TaxID=48701 RepID=A0A3B3XIJ0_9TELE